MVDLKTFPSTSGSYMNSQNDCGPLMEFSCVSQAGANVPVATILRLIRHTWRHNARKGITGILRVENRNFFHVVEGPCDMVLPLVSRILTDRRHEAISVISCKPVAARRFEGWRAVGLENDGSETSWTFTDGGNLHFLKAEQPHQSIAASADAEDAVTA